MGELISIIVPVHNAEQYLEMCVESLIQQSYKNLEIILVDDESADHSAQICDQYAQRDSRVRAIHKKGSKEGGASARNTGIEVSKGSILYFVDSDDYIEPEMLQTMYDKMCGEKSDGVICSFHYVDQEGKELTWRTPQLAGYERMSGVECAKLFLTTLDIEGFSWNKMFRREILEDNHIRFDESMNSFVDIYGMFQAILNCKQISFCTQPFYYYRQHNISCVHTITKRKLENFRRVVGQITEKAKEYGLEKEGDYYRIFRMSWQLFDALKNRSDYDAVTWGQVVNEFCWNRTFGKSLGKAEKILLSYMREARVKNCIKLFCVWVRFR